MKKTTAMIIMLLAVAVLFTIVILWKWYVYLYIKKIEKENINAIVTVSATQAKASDWLSEIQVVGNARTVKGVNVTPELAGMVTDIHIKPGSDVKQGDLLVQLDIAPELAKLRELEAEATLANITYRRNVKQYKVGGVSKETVDRNEGNLKSTTALAAEEKAIIAKKTVRAPFSGRLGVSLVNPGQYLNPGDTITTLQTLRPIYIDFYVPQVSVSKLKLGTTVKISVDAYPKVSWTAPITTINPEVDASVRNILVEATLDNINETILPGMFMYVTIPVGTPQQYITLPQMAISFNPYGAIAYVLKSTTQQKNGKSVWTVVQRFVTTGESRGNQIAVLSGIKAGERVVTAGQFKIKDGSRVVINNAIQPPDDPNPMVQEE